MTSRDYKEEIFREIDNLRQLDHPSIAKIYEIVTNASNMQCIVMELCDGCLEEFTKESKLKNELEIMEIIE